MNYVKPLTGRSVLANNKDRVAICVCTYLRPALLDKCLISLRRQRFPQDITPFLVVVDNDGSRSAQPIFNEFTQTAPFSCYYGVQPKRGIAAARNHAMGMANALGADWIAFIDDDEIADRDWIGWLMANNYRHVPVLVGRQVHLVPDQEPYWWEPRTHTPQEGKSLNTAVTNNVRFSTHELKGLCFDEGLGLGGGEDVKFFAEARAAGLEIKRTERAITYEKMHVSRITYKRIFLRHCWEANCNYGLELIRRGRLRTWARRLPSIPYHAVTGSALLALSPLLYAIDEKLWKRFMLKANKKLAKAWGRFTAMVSFVPQPYQIIDGE